MRGITLRSSIAGGQPLKPADLGYYIGYKIVESYYNRAKDKKQVIKDILDIKDFNAFLKASGYDEKFSVEWR